MSNFPNDQSQTEVEPITGALVDYYQDLMIFFLEKKYYQPFKISILNKPLRLIHLEEPKEFCIEQSFEQCLKQIKIHGNRKIMEHSEGRSKEQKDSESIVQSSTGGFTLEDLPGNLVKLENLQNHRELNELVYRKPLRFGWFLNSNELVVEFSLSECEIDEELGWILNRFVSHYNIPVLKLENNRFVQPADIKCAKFSEHLIGLRLNQISLDRTRLHGCNLSAVFMLRVEHISLRFCCLEDEDIHSFSESLALNDSLTALNLNFNRIKNDGCKYLAHSLRLNRTLSCLSLMHNCVENAGCQHILMILKPFLLTRAEVLSIRKVKLDRYIASLNKVHEPPGHSISKFQTNSESNKSTVSYRRRSKQLQVPKKNGFVKYACDVSKKSTNVEFSSVTSGLEAPENHRNTCKLKLHAGNKGLVYSDGNLHLSHLYLSHNPLSASILPEILTLLEYQQSLALPAGMGLVDLSIRNDVIGVDMPGLKLMIATATNSSAPHDQE